MEISLFKQMHKLVTHIENKQLKMYYLFAHFDPQFHRMHIVAQHLGILEVLKIETL